MLVDHIALYVRDLEQARDFFVTYFAAACGNLYHNPQPGFSADFLTLDEGARLEIMTRPQLASGEGESPGTGWHHLAFRVGSREKVDRLTRRLAVGGFPVLSAPRVTGDGYYESVVADGEGNPIEITA